MLSRYIIYIILCFAAGAAVAHALLQPAFNDIAKREAHEEAYRQSAVIGYVMMDDMGQLYFEEK
jgi:hypothetical protein